MSTIPSDETQDSKPRWLNADEARAWRGYLLMNRLLFTELGRGLSRDAGMSHADYEVLVHLSEAPDHRLRMNELGARMLWEKSRLSHQVTRMQQRRLVEREECRSDARGAFVVLTPEGLEAIKTAAPAHVADVRQHFFDLLTDDQVKTLAAITETVVEHLTRTNGAAAVKPGEGAEDCG